MVAPLFCCCAWHYQNVLFLYFLNICIQVSSNLWLWYLPLKQQQWPTVLHYFDPKSCVCVIRGSPWFATTFSSLFGVPTYMSQKGCLGVFPENTLCLWVYSSTDMLTFFVRLLLLMLQCFCFWRLYSSLTRVFGKITGFCSIQQPLCRVTVWVEIWKAENLNVSDSVHWATVVPQELSE